MTNKKSTKRALLSSALALVMCISMLIGSTFAWFTDSVTSSGNIIQSGSLKVTMEWLNGKDDPTATDAAWKDASEGAIFKSTLWEPGYTEVRHIKIENEGTLALKYKLNIVANGEVSDLADVIDVYYIDPATGAITDRTQLTEDKKIGTLTEVLAGLEVSGNGVLVPAGKEGDGYKSVETITIALKMQESAGNEYQEKAIGSDFAIQLLATQFTYEEDSFDNQYDKNALYPVVNAAEFMKAIEEGKSVKLEDDIKIEEMATGIVVDGGDELLIELNGKDLTLSSNATEVVGSLMADSDSTINIVSDVPGSQLILENTGIGVLDGGTVNISGVDVTTGPTKDECIAVAPGGVVNFSNGTINVVDGYGVTLLGGTFNMNGGTINVSTTKALKYSAAAIYFYNGIDYGQINLVQGTINIGDYCVGVLGSGSNTVATLTIENGFVMTTSTTDSYEVLGIRKDLIVDNR